MPEHTPTPWKVSRHIPTRIDGPADGRLPPNAVAEACDGNEKGEANAAYIVLAVNSHDALAEACRQARGAMIEPRERRGGYCGICGHAWVHKDEHHSDICWVGAICAALALAEPPAKPEETT